MLRFPPRRILAAVDPSEVSIHAAFAAPPFDDDARRREMLGALGKRLGADARLRVVRGDPVRTLRRLAADRKYDLLVMGTHRRAGLARVLLGSVAEAVVVDSPCPVLVVPTGLRSLKRVLAPINEEAYARRGLLAAGLIARAHKAKLTVLHVVTDPIFGMSPQRLLRKRIAELPDAVRREVRPEGEVGEFDVVRDILRASRGADLIVLAAHRKSLLGDFVLGTTVERVLRHSRVPVLAVPSGRS
ncbi:MAG: universal stress protein [Elusimicrobia bacterium]|nr:universal stress protein [Elusimicrobiota bacterium]